MTAIRAMAKAWRGILWVLALAASSATGAPPRCQAVSAADALHRLEVWGRELAGAKGPVAAHSSRHVAWVADRHGTALEALFLVTLREVRESGSHALAGMNPRRPRWIRCTGGIAEGRNDDGTVNQPAVGSSPAQPTSQYAARSEGRS